MRLTRFEVGDCYYAAALLRKGRAVDDAEGEKFSTRREAELDGVELRGGHSPAHEFEFYVRRWRVCSLDSGDKDGIGSAVTCD
jgi:hypothetical protein